jgi:RNA polymerase sigma factor (sigma-70 family)
MGQRQKIVSIIVGCCVLTFVLAMIAGVLTPDVNDTYDYTDDSSNVDENEPFKIDINNVSVVESSISFTSQDSKSSSYAYFYQDGSYAEPAYTTYDAKDFYIVLNMKDLEIDNDTSELEYSQPFGPTDTYNVSNLNKDISKLVKSDNATITMNCYDKEGNEILLEDVLSLDESEMIDEIDANFRSELLAKSVDKYLSAREKQIIKLRYGIVSGNELTQREVGKLLGISRSYVSRIEKKDLEKLGKVLY